MINVFFISPWATLGVFLAFILNLLVYWRHWHKLQPFSKPLAMITIILWTLSLMDWQVDGIVAVLILAQIFCLAGDIFLLFPKRWFMVGLVAFLIGHLFYLGLMASILAAGFHSDVVTLPSPLIILVGVIGLVLAMLVFWRVFRPAFRAKGSSKKLWFAMQVYAFILSSMTLASILLLLVQPGTHWQSMLIPLGGVLFFASDFMLAYDRFVKKNALLRLPIWITYHLAQISLGLGFVHLLT